jgi:hypothetical protein
MSMLGDLPNYRSEESRSEDRAATAKTFDPGCAEPKGCRPSLRRTQWRHMSWTTLAVPNFQQFKIKAAFYVMP